MRTIWQRWWHLYRAEPTLSALRPYGAAQTAAKAEAMIWRAHKCGEIDDDALRDALRALAHARAIYHIWRRANRLAEPADLEYSIHRRMR